MIRWILTLTVLFLFLTKVIAQDFIPVPVTGFNQDVVAEGNGSSTLAKTSREMDYFPISNNVLFTREFANSNGFTPANTYGLPNDGSFSFQDKTFQMAPYEDDNVLYLFAGDSGVLTFTNPSQFTNLSLLALSTEGNSNFRVTFHFADGSTQTDIGSVKDWFSADVPAGFHGYGRVKRIGGPMGLGTYQGAPANPRFSTLDYTVPCSKILVKIGFKNTSANGGQAFRTFILAVSGKEKKIRPAVRISTNDTLVCQGKPVSFTANTDSAGTTPQYEWKVNGLPVGSNQPTFSSSGLKNLDVVTCTLTSNVPCANPASVVSNSITVRILPLKTPEVRITESDSSVCQGTPVTFTALPTSAGNPPVFRWRLNGAAVGEDTNRFVLSNPTDGDKVSCLVLSTENCRTQNSATSNIRTLQVTLVYTPAFSVPDSLFVDGAPIELTGSPAGGVFSGPGITGNQFSPEQAGIGVHSLTYGFPGNTCTQPANRTIRVLEEILPCNLEPATLITPNGDGLNEVWDIGSFNRKCILSAEVEIFNRWGASVFKSSDYRNDWNGKSGGQDLLPGCYFFTLSITKAGEGKTLRKNGVLSILR